MFDRLLLKTIGTRLVEAGNCPYDPHCIHAGHNGCTATKEELKRREAAIKAEAEKEEPHRPIIVYLTLDTNKRWPCAESQAYVILLPDLEGGAEGA